MVIIVCLHGIQFAFPTVPLKALTNFQLRRGATQAEIACEGKFSHVIYVQLYNYSYSANEPAIDFALC